MTSFFKKGKKTTLEIKLWHFFFSNQISAQLTLLPKIAVKYTFTMLQDFQWQQRYKADTFISTTLLAEWNIGSNFSVRFCNHSLII